MIRLLLANTTLEIPIKGANTVTFQSNVGSPQGDGISGPPFNIYFEAALKDLRNTIEIATPHPNLDHVYSSPAIARR